MQIVTAKFKTMLGRGKVFQRTFETTCRKEHTAIEAVTDHIVYAMRGFDVKIVSVKPYTTVKRHVANRIAV